MTEMDGTESLAICPECEGWIWIADANGELHLMRLGEIPLDECATCTRVHEAVS